MEIRRCVMKVDIWAELIEGSKDFFPFVEVQGKNETYFLPKYNRIIFDKTLGIGEVWWIEDCEKKKLPFQCNCWTWVNDKGCFRISTIEEAQALFEQYQKEESSRCLVPKKKRKKNKKPVFTIVQCPDLEGYALLDMETGELEGYFKLLTEPSEYPQYAKLIAGMKLFAKNVCGIFQ